MDSVPADLLSCSPFAKSHHRTQPRKEPAERGCPQGVTASLNTENSEAVPRMFDRIARRYDLLNRMLSFGRDTAWRRALARAVGSRPAQSVLDVATGTGDVLLTLADECGALGFCVGCDKAAAMLELARGKITRHRSARTLTLVRSDAARLAFFDSSFDAATMAFGIRNIADVMGVLREVGRVIRPGGRIFVLEFSLPRNPLIRVFYLAYLRRFLPFFGGLISGDFAAYRYLNRTVEAFPCGEAFCELLRAAAFVNVHSRPLTLGVTTLYSGEKP